jgi:hypothetical protein
MQTAMRKGLDRLANALDRLANALDSVAQRGMWRRTTSVIARRWRVSKTICSLDHW